MTVDGKIYRECLARLAVHIIFIRVSAMTDGVAATPMPASLKAAILVAAVPLPPLTIAPAWPMRRPGGAVAPAMKPAAFSGTPEKTQRHQALVAPGLRRT